MDMVKKFLDEKRGLSGQYGCAAQSATEAEVNIHETQIATQAAALSNLSVPIKPETGVEQEWDVSKTCNPLILVRRRLSRPDTVASYRVPEHSPLREDATVWCRDMNARTQSTSRAAGVTPATRTAVTGAATPAGSVPPPTVPVAPTVTPLSPPGPLSPMNAPPPTPVGLGLPMRPAPIALNVPNTTPISIPATAHVALRSTIPDVPVNPSDIEMSPARGMVSHGHATAISVPAPSYTASQVTPPTGGPPKTTPRVVLRLPNIGRSAPLVAGQPTVGVPSVTPSHHAVPHTHAPVMIPTVPVGPVPMVTNPMHFGSRPVAVPTPGVLRSPASGPVPLQRAVPPHPLSRGPPSFPPKVRVLSPGVAPPHTGVPAVPMMAPKGPGISAPSGNLVVKLNPGATTAAPGTSMLGSLVSYCMKKYPTQAQQVREIATQAAPEQQRVEILRNFIRKLDLAHAKK